VEEKKALAFERYRGVIPDWRAFEEALATPEPVTLRVRSGRTSEARLVARLEEQGFGLAPVPGAPGYWRVERGPGSIAQTLEHWLGLFHVQQAVMGLPTLALAPRPGERVLDLCAAPGGKTSHLAELMEDRGPLVAVDPKEKRLRGLLGNLYRLGHPNVLVVAADGRELPAGAEFDRILVDAPCSAEGTSRRQGGRVAPRDPGFVEHVTGVQEALLRRAAELLRPGGVLVYSTCTFAPEENEGVVSRVLADSPLQMERISLDAPHAPGLAEWEGERFDPALSRAWRVYPHMMDSGGLFMARLRKEGPVEARVPREPSGSSDRRESSGAADGGGWSPVPVAFPGEDAVAARERIVAALEELELRFGMKRAVLERIGWMARGGNVWAHTAERWPVPTWEETASSGRWRVVSLGIRALKKRSADLETPSNHFLARWGTELGDDRKVDLRRSDLASLMSDLKLSAPDLPVGPVAILWDGMVVGRGMVGGGGLLRHEIPGPSAERLRTLLGIDTPAREHAGPAGGRSSGEEDSDPTELDRTRPAPERN
jgi:NOL1/NOP2/sun family putative RNA methylase